MMNENARGALTVAELGPKVEDVIRAVEDVKVYNDETYRAGVEIRRSIKGLLVEIDRCFDPIIEDANRAHKTALSKKKEFAERPNLALRAIDRKLADHESAVRRLEEEERRKKLEAEEAKRRADAALKKAEGFAVKGDVARAEKTFEKAAAEETKASEIERTLAPPPPRPVVPGTYSVEIWRARIVDPKLVPREYCVPDPVALNREARESQGKKVVPGVEFFSTREMRSRG
jgi:hypothetical protein